jgi:serine/threonine protein kinase
MAVFQILYFATPTCAAVQDSKPPRRFSGAHCQANLPPVLLPQKAISVPYTPVPYLTSHNLADKVSEDKVLGEGGFGKVERRTLCASACVTEKNSIDCTNPISVAQKMFIDREDTQQNANQLVGLQREAQLMTRVACPSDPSLLEHPGRRYVVQTYAIINDGSCSREDPMSISMKVYTGGDLSSYLDKHKSTLQECSAKTELALKIATGLQYIHAVGITHRDLHTGNVLFDNAGNPAITDFGISMNGNRKEKFLSISGNNEINVYETVQIFAHPPEYVAIGHNVKSDKSDVYSLGRLFEQILYDVDTVDQWKAENYDLGKRQNLDAVIARVYDLPLDLALGTRDFGLFRRSPRALSGVAPVEEAKEQAQDKCSDGNADDSAQVEGRGRRRLRARALLVQQLDHVRRRLRTRHGDGRQLGSKG